MSDTTPADMPIGTRVRLARTAGLYNRRLLDRVGCAGTVVAGPRYDGCVCVKFDRLHPHDVDMDHWWVQPRRLDPAE